MPRRSPNGRVYRKDWLRSLRLSPFWRYVVAMALEQWAREET